MVTLSVHLMTYNNEDHLEETLNSIVEQEVNFTFEVIISDDCSTDATWVIIEDYASKYPNIINAQKNAMQLGIIKNYKTTLDRCIGKYVFSIAGDDYLLKKNALQQMVDVLENNPQAGFLDSGINMLYESSNTSGEFSNRSILKAPKEAYINEVVLGRIMPTGLCFNKSLLDKYVNFDEYISMGIEIEDYPILVNLAMNTEFKRVLEPLVVYRIHDSSYSHTKTFENHYALKKQMNTLFNHFKLKYSFSEDLISEFHLKSQKELLYLAAYFEKPKIGKEAFYNITQKSTRDYIHYWASQSPFLRKFIRSTRWVFTS